MSVNETIKKQNEICNLTEWHDNGITGENIVVWNCESANTHGKTSTRRVLDSAPEAVVYNNGIGAKFSHDTLDYVIVEGEDCSVEEFIVKNKIKILTRSMESDFAGKDESEYRKFWEDLQKKYNLVIFNSTGNIGYDEQNRPEGHDLAILVGAINNNFTPANYTAVTDDVDFADFTGVWSGTSFSCPYLAGKSALLLERYGDMSQDEIFKYFKMCAKDVHEPGEDNRTGHGLVVLPEFTRKYITMTTNSNVYYVNGNEYEMDTKPMNIEGNVFVPIRVISEALGATVEWFFNPDKSIKVIVAKGLTRLELNTNTNVVTNNGRVKYLNVAPFIDENNRTLVPIRFIAESFNCSVDWIQRDSKVMILER